ncbi:hypothetical protein [Candidatus Uabimicrobium sp. HlEnr_7]|uniref:hypothetical protein n=1 Tax=Candidatus Uabimicrobium helgolandensis TaxID=3095367 RepID=UPI00355818AB
MYKKSLLLILLFTLNITIAQSSNNNQDYVDGNQREFIGPKFLHHSSSISNIINSTRNLDSFIKNYSFNKRQQVTSFNSGIENIRRQRSPAKKRVLFTEVFDDSDSRLEPNPGDDLTVPNTAACSVQITKSPGTSKEELTNEFREILKKKIRNEIEEKAIEDAVQKSDPDKSIKKRLKEIRREAAKQFQRQKKTIDAKVDTEIKRIFLARESALPRIFFRGVFNKLESEGFPNPKKGEYKWIQNDSGFVNFRSPNNKDTKFSSQNAKRDPTPQGLLKEVTIQYTCPGEEKPVEDSAKFAITIPKTSDRIISEDKSLGIFGKKKKNSKRKSKIALIGTQKNINTVKRPITIAKKRGNTVIITQESPPITTDVFDRSSKDGNGILLFNIRNTYRIHDQDGFDMNLSLRGGKVLKVKEEFLSGKLPNSPGLRKLRNKIFNAIKKQKSTTQKFIGAINGNLIQDNIFASLDISDIKAKSINLFISDIDDAFFFEIIHKGFAAIEGEKPIAEVWVGKATVTFFNVVRSSILSRRQKRTTKTLEKKLAAVKKKLTKKISKKTRKKLEKLELEINRRIRTVPNVSSFRIRLQYEVTDTK